MCGRPGILGMGHFWGALASPWTSPRASATSRDMDEDAVVSKLEEIWRGSVAADPRAELRQWREREPDKKHALSVPTASTQRLLALICSRYGLGVYRAPRQRSTTVCVDAPVGFVREVLWPPFHSMAMMLEQETHQLLERVVERWARSTDQDQK